RFGVLVHGSFGDEGGSSGIFAVVLEYSPSGNELTAQLYGDMSNPAPWVALSYVISAVRSMLSEFPGLRSKGSMRCPQHGDAMPLTTAATRVADRLLLESAGCPLCSSETGGHGAAAAELLLMVDVGCDRGVIYDEVKARFEALDGRYSFPGLSTDSSGEHVLDQMMRILG
ncbi:unnamed protein product, partial [Scytosiphon promiscuus]